MLPDFFSLKRELSKRFRRQLRSEIDAHAPVWSQIRAYVMVEGDTFSFQTVDGDVQKQKFKMMTHRIEVPADLPPEQMQLKMQEKFREMTEAMGRKFETSLFESIREVTDRTGLALDARGKPFHPSMLWDMVEKMPIDFDKEGNPMLPCMVVHPDMFKAIEPKIPEWESDPELRRRRSEVLARKKEEWLDREARRKLVG